MNRLFSKWWLVCLLGTAGLAAVVLFTPVLSPRCTRIKKVFLQIDTLEDSLRAYHLANGRYPSTADGLDALRADAAGLEGALRRIPVDPWGGSYVYRLQPGSSEHQLYSMGRDGADDGGAGDDIIDGKSSYTCADYGVNCPLATSEILFLTSLFAVIAGLLTGAVRGAMALWRMIVRG